MGIHRLCALAQNTIGSHSWIFTDVNQRPRPFLCHCKELAARMNRNGANSVSVKTWISLVLMCSEIKRLIAISSYVDNDVVFKEVDVVSLE